MRTRLSSPLHPSHVAAVACVVALLGAPFVLRASPPESQVPPAKIVVVDVQKVLTMSKAGKDASEFLHRMQNDAIDMAKGMSERIEKLENDLSQTAASLSEEERARRRQTIENLRNELRRFSEDQNLEIGKKRDSVLRQLETQIKPIIDTIAKEKGITAIFNKFESGLVYVDEAADITDLVIQRFDGAGLLRRPDGMERQGAGSTGLTP